MQNPNNPLQRLTTSSIIGDNVVNREGKALGKIQEIMVDLTEGRIEYFVIGFGGILGMNQKFFAVPFKALTIAKEHRHAFILNEPRESFLSLPGFDKDHWPQTNFHQNGSGNAPFGGFMGSEK